VSNEKPWIYIASPYTRGDVAINVRAQMEAFDAILAMVAIPIAPLFSHFQHMFKPRPYEDWIELDLEIVKRCDACIRLEAVAERSDGTVYRKYESSGADGEVMAFARMAKPVFVSMHALEAWIDGRMFPKTVSASSPDGSGGAGAAAGVSGLRKERVVLEVTHNGTFGHPSTWPWLDSAVVRGWMMARHGESVRVVPEAEAEPRDILKPDDTGNWSNSSQLSMRCRKLARDAEELRQQVETARGLAATAERERDELRAKLRQADRIIEIRNHCIVGLGHELDCAVDQRDALAARVAAMEADMAAAAGECGVALPEHGSDTAKLLHANVMMRKYRIPGLQARVAELEAESKAWHDAGVAVSGMVSDRNAKIAAMQKAAAEPVASVSIHCDTSAVDAKKAGMDVRPLCRPQHHSSDALAWGVMLPNKGGLYDHFDFEHEADAVCESVRKVEGVEATVVPLYTAPPPAQGWLTGEEREALFKFALPAMWESHARAMRDNRFKDGDASWSARTVVERLLARNAPPKVVLPEFVETRDCHDGMNGARIRDRDSLWKAALAAAGVECKS
jgi:hypothetical protein